MTETVTARIPDEMKEGLEEEDINVSEVIRDALEKELTERRRERLKRDVDSLRERLDDGVETDEIVSAVRETREER